MQLAPPGPSVVLPLSQGMHPVAPLFDPVCSPLGHGWQPDMLDELPETFPKRPAGQGTQTSDVAAASVGEYVPGEQLTQLWRLVPPGWSL